MKRQQFQITDWREGQARLDHYNKWLMDPKRVLGASTYPGFPEDKNKSYSEVPEHDVTVLPKKLAVSTKVSHNKQTENLKGYMMTKVTNLSRATEIVKAAATKAEALDKIVAELGVKRANAFVYFTKATKALGSAPANPKAPKADKAPAKAKSKVTELSPEKAAKKVAEIDAVIAGLKANGAKVASPFAQLGA